jgi:hypothetical protein
MDNLRGYIDNKLQKLDRNSYAQTMVCCKFQDKENVPILESIFSILKSFDERLKKIEEAINNEHS